MALADDGTGSDLSCAIEHEKEGVDYKRFFQVLRHEQDL
jgi:hypothetical protein